MRTIRTKRVKNETNKYLLGPFDESLIQIQLDKNEKCIQELNKDNFERANELLKQIKIDSDMISSYNREKYVLKSLSLNTEAYFYQKQNKFEDALKCLDQAESIELEQKASPIDLARTKLNKSVILSHVGKHEQAISLGKQALELLKRKKQMQFFQLKKNQYKLYQIMTISFYNIASSLSHLSNMNEAGKVYKEGYYLAQKTLGPNHKLTILLRSIVKQNNRQLSKSREKIQMQRVSTNKSQNHLIKNSHTLIIPFNQKEKELKRIYASKKKSYTSTKDRNQKKQLDYYLKSFEKIKELYSKNKRKSKNNRFYTTNRMTENDQQNQISQPRRMLTDSIDSVRRQKQLEHQKVKDIILNGKTINRTNLYIKRIPQLQNQKSLKNEKSKGKISTTNIQTIPPIIPSKPQQPQLTLVDIAKKVQQKNKADSQSCQII